MKLTTSLLVTCFLAISSVAYAAEPANANSKNTTNTANQNAAQSSSVYESIRSGWNSFIDTLTGTKGSSDNSQKQN